MNTRNSIEKFQNIFQEQCFFHIIHKITTERIHNIVRAFKGRIFALTKKISRGRLFPQNILNAVLVFEGQQFGHGRIYTRYPKR